MSLGRRHDSIGYYAGIGSRTTPAPILLLMQELGKKLAREGYILRSGGAKGADCAFEVGCLQGKGMKQIFHANDATTEARKIAKQFHPSWDACDAFARKLLARNAMILLGENLDFPVKVVICWTPDGEEVGGTGHSLRIARAHQIPIRNLGKADEMAKAKEWLSNR